MKNKKLKISIIIICVAIVAVIVGVCGKKAYDKHLEEVRQEKIAATNSEIEILSSTFEKQEDRAIKLEDLQAIVDSYEKYKKSDETFDECLEKYANVIASEKKYFEDDYNSTITANTVADVNVETDKDKLNGLVSTLTAFKDALKTEYETYGTISEDKFNELNTTIDTLVTSYTDRVNAILAEEEAKRQAEEEARKKAEEEAAAKAAEEADSKKSKGSSSGNSGSSSSSSGSSKKKSGSSSNNSSSSSNSSNGASSGTNYKYDIDLGEGNHTITGNTETGDYYIDGEWSYNVNDNPYFN